MSSAQSSAAPARRRSWTTPQHGAWAMLLLPFFAGLTHGTTWVHVPLLVAWIAGYLASYFASLGLKTRRWERYRPQVLVYGGLALVAGVIAVVAAPRVLIAAPVFVVGASVMGIAARRRRDRSLVAGLAAVVQACAMALIVPIADGDDLGTGWREALICLLYLAGSVLFVKTMIRERNSLGYRRASLTFHVVALGVATALDPLFAVPFAGLLGRALVLPGRRVPVVAVGMIELAASIVVLVFLFVT